MARKKRPDRKEKPEGTSDDSGMEMELLKELMESFGDLGEMPLEEILRMVPSGFPGLSGFPELNEESGPAYEMKLPAGFEEAVAILDSADPDEDESIAIEAAKKAIKTCPQYVEAYLRLAEFENSPVRVTELYHEAAEQGRWMIDAIADRDIWNNPLLATYLNFRVQMADHLWNYGQRVDSIEHLMDVHRLDPEDDVCSRFRLAFRLFDLGWEDELKELLESGDGLHTEACDKLLETLIEFRSHGDSIKARQSLVDCVSSNPLLIDFLVGEAMLPMPADFDPESEPLEEDAISLAHVVLPIVRSLPGLARWIRETLDFRPQDQELTKEDREQDLQIVSGLQQSEESWIIDCRKVNEFWLLFVYSVEEEEPVRIESFDEKPTTGILWEALLDTMRDPKGEARRPTKIVVSKSSLAKSWSKRCERLSIHCEFSKSVQIPESVIEEFFEMMSRTEEELVVDDALLEEIRELSQGEDVWIAGLFQPPLWISDSATPRRPLVVIVVDSETGMVLMQDMADAVTDTLISHSLLKAMVQPLVDMPAHRPSKILIHHDSFLGEMPEFFSELGIECVVAEGDESEPIDECVESLIRHVSGPEGRHSLVDTEGITQSEIGQLFQSVARFWKSAPWRTVPGDRPIELQSELFEKKVWYAVIVGQMGMNLGVVLYDDKDAMDAVMSPDTEEAEPNGVFLNFLEKFEIPAIDLWFQEQFGWPVAAEEAYPLIERALPKLQHRRPNRNELIALDVALKILPAFVSRPESRDTFQLPITSFADRAEVRARWV